MMAIIAIALYTLLPVGASAQVPTGNLKGTVNLPNGDGGGALYGVTVVLDPNGGRTGPQVQTTNAEGQFMFLGLSPGTHSLQLVLQGFDTVTVPVNIQAERVTTETLTMNPAVRSTVTAPPAASTPKQIAGIVRDDGWITAGSGFSITRHSVSPDQHGSQYFAHFTVSFPSGTWSTASLPVPVITKLGSLGNVSIGSINNSPAGLTPTVAADGSFSFRVNVSEPNRFPVTSLAFSFTVTQS
ncbi:MAG: carboxypeptidase regulatory-like domain-containing protein [Acidimicrobiia bacterium]|nr:carboxypeptidase regulatory-like domain-containing protein [Acidimicrobiia bacterium]